MSASPYDLQFANNAEGNTFGNPYDLTQGLSQQQLIEQQKMRMMASPMPYQAPDNSNLLSAGLSQNASALGQLGGSVGLQQHQQSALGGQLKQGIASQIPILGTLLAKKKALQDSLNANTQNTVGNIFGTNTQSLI